MSLDSDDGQGATGEGAAGAQALVIGASGGIGQAVLEHWLDDLRFDRVWATTRDPAALADLETEAGGRLRVLAAPPTASRELETALNGRIETVLEGAPRLSRVAITVGTLHSADYQPEKSLGALRSDALGEVYRVNCILPLLWVAALGRGLRRSRDCRVAVLSARVGSIEDNGLGGWYSYRCSKAALNMGLKSAAIELARRAPGVKLLAYHPGTVATGLSAPFQRGVAPQKLFSPSFTARCLSELLDDHGPDGQLHYLDWAGAPIPW